jgi:hypothetical protein
MNLDARLIPPRGSIADPQSSSPRSFALSRSLENRLDQARTDEGLVVAGDSTEVHRFGTEPGASVACEQHHWRPKAFTLNRSKNIEPSGVRQPLVSLALTPREALERGQSAWRAKQEST